MTSDTLWVVAADGGSARFFARSHAGIPLQELQDLALTAEGERRMHHHATAVHEATDHGAHVLPAHQNEEELAERHFLRHIAGRINLAVDEHAARQIVLCASPRALGILRRHLSKSAADRVIYAIPKDLMREAVGQIDERLHQLRV